MPKKQTNESETPVKRGRKPQQKVVSEPVQETSVDQTTTEVKVVAGRTILARASNSYTLDQQSLVGLKSCIETKTSTSSTKSQFLTFDTIENATNAFNKLNNSSQNLQVKYSYYKIFFTMTGLTDTTDYAQVKSDFMKFVETKTTGSVLFCKLYRKDDKYLGCGDLTVDTLEGMTNLISKDNSNKEYTLGGLSGTFYRFNGNRTKPNTVTI